MDPMNLCDGHATAAVVDCLFALRTLFVSIYLHCSEGFSPKNWAIMNAVGEYIVACGLPYVLAGDFNMSPQVLQDSGWHLRKGLTPIDKHCSV